MIHPPQLPVQAVQVLAEQMKSNHTILGLHFDGANNKGYVDPNGFLVPLACKNNRPKIIAPPCWMCGGWREHKFYFRENGSLREIARREDDDAVCQYDTRSRMLRSTKTTAPSFFAQELERKFQLDGKVDLEMLGVKDNTR